MKDRSIKIDAVDRKILRILYQHAKSTNMKLAEMIGLSAAPTLERVKKLERHGLITGYHAGLNYRQLGLPVMAFVWIELKKKSAAVRQKFLAFIQKHPACIECYHVTGMADFLLKIVAKDLHDYQAIVLQITDSMDGVLHTQSMMVLSIDKAYADIAIP